MSKENILIVHNYYKIAGGEDTVVTNEKRLLEKNGHKVILYTRSNQEISSMSPLQKLYMGISSLYSLRTYREIRQIIKAEQIDIVQVHNTLSLITPSVYYAALSQKKPVFQTIHNFRLVCPNALLYRNNHICHECLQHGLHRSLLHKCYHQSFLQTLFCVLSDHLHRMTGIYRKLYYVFLTPFNQEIITRGMQYQILPSHCSIKPNFMEDQFDTIENISLSKESYFLYLGRLDASKGLRYLLEEWQSDWNQKLHARLLIAGDGPLRNLVAQAAAATPDIQYLGSLNHDTSLSAIKQAQALILPSQWYEGFPMTVVESMMCGTPVICQNIGNTADLIRPLSPDTIIDTKHSLASIIKNFDKTIYTDRYRAYYVQNYTPATNYKIMTELFRNLKKKN